MSKEEIINKTKKNAPFVIAFLVGVCIAIVTFSDDRKMKTAFDGIIVSDKVGNSFMLEHSFGSRFKVVEFDVVKMRAKRD